MTPLFLYGTLRHAPLLAAVSGDDRLGGEPATLAGHRVAHAVSLAGEVQNFPLFSQADGQVATGLLIRPSGAARTRLDAYERAFGYDVSTVTVETAQGPVQAAIYLPQADLWRAGADWSLAVWQLAHGALTVAVAAEVMALLAQDAPANIMARYTMLEQRVASRTRAMREPAPARLRRLPRQGDVMIEATARPYSRFFGIEEATLRFRRFDGTLGPQVERTAFVMADAVTVLPYDARRDRVLVVEQFRFGPQARGDANPWSLEPIAGRIDPGETPEQTARRETREEAALDLGPLEPVGRYYPSPGAVTEYLLSYVGLADLPDEAQGVNGLEAEAEDIRAHVISYRRLMELVESGEVENGPLLLSAFWLARHRTRLRRAAR
ncbi:MAG: NUDIX domain-containing protein [Pararhodobacter sp.]